MNNVISLILKRDLFLAFVRKGYFFTSLFFCVISTMLLQFIYENSTLNFTLLLIPYLFSSVLSSNEIFREDSREYVLQQLIATGCTPAKIVIAKLLGHYLQSLLVIGALIIFVSLLYGLNPNIDVILVYVLLALSVSSIVVFASSLTLAVNHNMVILSLIIMPLLMSLFLFSAVIIDLSTLIDNFELVCYNLKIMGLIAVFVVICSFLSCSYSLSKIQ